MNIAESLHLRFNNDSLVRDLTVEIADRNKAEDRLKSINEEPKQTISLYNAANRELNKAQRVIHALSESNHAVIHIGDEAELLRAICRIAVDVGGYRMAWVGYAEDDRDQTVTPVARYGYEKAILRRLRSPGKMPRGERVLRALASAQAFPASFVLLAIKRSLHPGSGSFKARVCFSHRSSSAS